MEGIVLGAVVAVAILAVMLVTGAVFTVLGSLFSRRN